MHLAASEYLAWGVCALLEVAVCLLAARRGVSRRWPFFFAYVCVVLVSDTLRFWVYHHWGFGSWTAWYAGWITQACIMLARATVVVELCWGALKAYRGIWALTWRLLLGVALLLLANAAVDTRRNAQWILSFVLTAERGLELAAAGVLACLLFACAYYRIRMERACWLIALGLCFYSSVQVMNNSFMRVWLGHYVLLWNAVRIISYQVTLVLWLAALRRPLRAEAPSPALLPQEVYDELSPHVNYRLRDLNQRLMQMLKP